MAMMMARLYTGAHDLVTLRNAYHGLSGAPRAARAPRRATPRCAGGAASGGSAAAKRCWVCFSGQPA